MSPAFQEVYNSTEGLRTAVGGWFSDLWNNELSPAFQEMYNSTEGLRTAVGGWFSDLWNNELFPAFTTMGNNLLNFKDNVGNWFTDVGGWFSEQTDNTLNFFKDIPNFITGFWTSFKDFLIGIFVPESGYFDNIMNDFKTSLANKLPYDTYMNLFNDINDVAEGEPAGLSVGFSGYKVGNKTVNTASRWVKFGFILEHKNTWFVWVRGFTYVFFVIYNINQLLKLLRGNPISDGTIQPNSGSGGGNS